MICDFSQVNAMHIVQTNFVDKLIVCVYVWLFLRTIQTNDSITVSVDEFKKRSVFQCKIEVPFLLYLNNFGINLYGLSEEAFLLYR